MGMKSSTVDKVTAALREHKPFRNSTGHMRGVEGTEGTGRLEGDALTYFRRDNPRYTVYSYATPIAWVSNTGQLRMPAVDYSPTTRQHQGAVKYAWNL